MCAAAVLTSSHGAVAGLLLHCMREKKMATGTGKHKLLSIGPTEPWSIREKLCLASSVMRSGDQNWVSVSRAIKPFAEPGRPPDWFSQKHCASQYSELLETTETPKRKRGERGEVVETVEDVIVRKLTTERIEELKKTIKETQEKYRKLKKEAELIQSGHMDSKLDELWNNVVIKKKQEEEEADMKKKATDAAYQARQAAKNIPRRSSSTIGRTSVGSSSPGGEFGLGDLTPNSTEEGSMGVSVGSLPNTPVSSFIGIPDTPPPPAPLESPLTPVMDDSPQKKMVGQKATPPPSPLLSELLKKGSLLSTSPRLVSENEMTLGSNTGSGVLMDVGVLPSLHGGELHSVAGTIPASPAASVIQQEDNESTCDPHTVSVSMDSSDISMIIDSINKECLGTGDGSTPSKDESSDSKGDLDLAEKMDIAVSYTGEELDFETVGDIIAIIEDKVDDHPEVLDVAAVEAALSFCEENDDPQALGGPWDQAVQEHTVKQETLPKSLIPGSKDTNTIMNIMELTDIKAEPSEPEMELAQSEGASVTPHSAFQLKSPVEEFTESSGNEPVKEEEELTDHQMKMEEPQCETSQSEAFSNEEEKGMPSEESPSVNDSIKLEPPSASQNKDSLGEEEEEDEDVTSEVGSPEEPKEEEAGEEYLSEMDNEPPISESDDGFSIHNAQLQSHTLADSIPSSPASSQFSVCSEDQEAIQAQKIWKKAIMLVWRAAANHRYANVFLQPVTDDIAPGYHSIVQRPMDLSTIKKNIETGLIRSTAEFQRDIMLMFQNAVMYNSSDHDVYHMAVEMQRDVLEQIQQFLATQLIMQTSESGISAKSLRGRDSTRKQDASEKDSVPMGSPAFLLSLFEFQSTTLSSKDSNADDESSFPGHSQTPVFRKPHMYVHSHNGQTQLAVFKQLEIAEVIVKMRDPEKGPSTTSVDDLMSITSNCCMEICSEVDGGCLRNNVEVIEEGQSQLDLEMTENSDTTDIIQTSDMVFVRKETILCWSQGQNVEDLATECIDQVYSPQLQEPVSEVDAPSHISQSEISVCERTKCIIPKTTSMLELLVLNSREFNPKTNTRKKMAPIWKMIADHRFARPFLKPLTDREAPGYTELVKRPMDLSTIKKGLSKGRIRTSTDFQRDILLMLQNAVMYNSFYHCVHQKALEIQRDVQELLEVFNTNVKQGDLE
ncbi:bromodomain-containing protein 8 isoform X2 [Dendrobates tinctorius]|uniref:bromodomain-containing protein 8 isoform X2 n=1 Tax=Dendrobates tinctorius TaxID=92724 RepID=UPI003CC93D07